VGEDRAASTNGKKRLLQKEYFYREGEIREGDQETITSNRLSDEGRKQSASFGQEIC